MDIDIKELIPHRDPIIMIDQIISHSEQNTITCFKIIDSNIFVQDNFFQSAGLIENMAQSAAARFGIQNYHQRDEPPLGYIASIKNLIINRCPCVGEKIFTKIINKHQINQLIMIDAEILSSNNIISSCELKVFIEN